MATAPKTEEKARALTPVQKAQQIVAKGQNEFAKNLPPYIPSEKFVRTAQTAIAHTRNIDKAKPESLMLAISKAAADGLILDGREAALVIDYQGEVQYRPMMRGLLKLAYNSGMINSISVQVVYENDEFEYVLGDEERITHRPNILKGRGEPIAVYAIATLKDGASQREVMTVPEVNRIRDRSDAWKAFKAKKIRSTPWDTDWSEMARKTVFRRLSKYLPSSTDNDRLHQAVERIDEDYNFRGNNVIENDPSAPPPKARGAASARLKNIKSDDTPPHNPRTGEIIENDDPSEGEGPPPHDDIPDGEQYGGDPI